VAVNEALKLSYSAARKVVIAVVGATVVLLGVAMIVLPGPGILVIPLGLGILGVEFAWARRWLEQLREESSRVVGWLRGRVA